MKRSIEPGTIDENPMRNRLLDVALELFTRKGYDSTSVSEIVAGAGASQPVLYYYFKNKQDLFLALVDKALIGFDQVVSQAPRADLPCKERLIDLCLRGYQACQANPVLTRLMFSLGIGQMGAVPVSQKIDPIVAKFYAMIEEIVREGRKIGDFGQIKPHDLAWAIWALLFKAMEENLFRTDRGPAPATLRRILLHLLAGFGPDSPETTPPVPSQKPGQKKPSRKKR